MLAQQPCKVLDPAGNITDEEQIVPHEVDPISFSECSIELDTGAGGDHTLFVLFGLLAVRTLQHGEGAAARLCAHRSTLITEAMAQQRCFYPLLGYFLYMF